MRDHSGGADRPRGISHHADAVEEKERRLELRVIRGEIKRFCVCICLLYVHTFFLRLTTFFVVSGENIRRKWQIITNSV